MHEMRRSNIQDELQPLPLTHYYICLVRGRTFFANFHIILEVLGYFLAASVRNSFLLCQQCIYPTVTAGELDDGTFLFRMVYEASIALLKPF